MFLEFLVLGIAVFLGHWYLNPSNQLYRLAMELGIPGVTRKAIRTNPTRFLQHVTDQVDDQLRGLSDSVHLLISGTVDDGTHREYLKNKLDLIQTDRGRAERCAAIFDLLLELDYRALAADKDEWQEECEEEALMLEAACAKLARISARIK